MSKSIKSKVSVLLALFIALAAVFTIMPVEVEAMTGDIHVYTRDASSGTREAFEEKAGYKGELTDLAVEVASNGDMAVKVGQDPQAIGYVSLTTDFEANNIKPVQYAGVDATEANVLSGDYKLARPFSYVTRAAGDFESQEKEDLIKAFVAFLLESDEGLGAVEAAGGIVDYSNARPWSEIAAEHPIVDQDNSGIELITTGSTSVVKTLDSAKEVFSPLAGGVTFKSEHPGSGEGWKRTLGDEKDSANRADIGFASRDFKDDEDTADGMLSGVYCLDAVVTAVHVDNPIENISATALPMIFKGEVTSWDEVEAIKDEAPVGMTGDVHVYTRDASSGTREAFEEKAGFKGELTDLAVEVASNGDMAVKVGQDPQAIGYVSLTTDFEANNIKPVKYDGVDATEANVLSGDYKLARPFSYVTRAAGDFESQEKEDLIKAFVAFLTESEEGLGAVEAAGGIVDYSNARPWSEIAEEHPIVDQDNSAIELITTGSTSVVKTLDSAKEAFIPLAGNVTFKSEHPGSGEGWKRTLGDEKDSANRADIGFASRDFKDDEDISNGMMSGVYCLDAVVTAVHVDNPTDNISAAALPMIFKGEITKWENMEVEEDVETLEGVVHVYTRDASSGTREAFEEKAGFKGELTDLAVEVASNGDMAVKVGQDPQAIGYVSLTTDFEANNIKPVKYDGVDATEANVLSGDYKLARPFSYVTRAAGDFESQEKEDLIKAFVAFLTESEEGLGAVEAAGGIVDYSNARPWSEIAEEHPIVDQDNSAIELITTGSTSVVKTLDSAKEAFIPLAGNVTFKSEHPGSGEGWKRTLGDEKDSANRADIGFASRDFKDDEDISNGMMSGVYCLDAVVTAVHVDNPIENISAEMLPQIFKGEITEWSEVK